MEIKQVLTNLPSAKILKKISEHSKTFWKKGSKTLPTIDDVKRIIINGLMARSLEGKTFTSVKIGTSFSNEIRKWLQDNGYIVIKTEKCNIDNIEANLYTISWENYEEDNSLEQESLSDSIQPNSIRPEIIIPTYTACKCSESCTQVVPVKQE